MSTNAVNDIPGIIPQSTNATSGGSEAIGASQNFSSSAINFNGSEVYVRLLVKEAFTDISKLAQSKIGRVFGTSLIDCEICGAFEASGVKELSSSDTSRRIRVSVIALLSMLFSMFAFVCWVDDLREKYWHRGTRKVSTRHPQHMRPQRKVRYCAVVSSTVLLLLFFMNAALSTHAEPVINLRDRIINGTEPCLQYTPERNLFYLNCSILHWRTQGYGPDTYISLSANETFDGNANQPSGGETGKPIDNIVDLSGVENFEGLFRINEEEVQTFAEAPLISNVHVRNGTVAKRSGFIVQAEQKYVKIESCSSTGDITENDAGGICGFKCGRKGIVNITLCYSTGNMDGYRVGGICGNKAGSSDGKIYVAQSYSTGEILSGGSRSGAIVGSQAAFDKGYVQIQECYSTGNILAAYAGGVIGATTAKKEGEVLITDCYSRGVINGLRSGGITGAATGGCCTENSEMYGNVSIYNSYSSGILKSANAGGFVGGIDDRFQGHTIRIEYSVYNGIKEGKKFGNDEHKGNIEEKGNSNNLTEITGQLYHYDGVQRWHNTTWFITVRDSLPILRFQPLPSPSPSPSSTRTATPTSSITPTPTTTRTATSSRTGTPTPSATWTATSSRTETPTPSATWTATSSSTETPTPSATWTATSSRTETPTPSATWTATSSRTATVSSSPSPSTSRSATRTSSSTSSPSTSPSSSPSSSTSPRALILKRILPVQRPPRYVQQHWNQGKKRRKKRN